MPVCLTSLIVLLVAHYVGDFLLQSRKIANNKHNNWLYLLAHGGLYSVALFIFVAVFTPNSWLPVLEFTVINAASHILIDKVTSTLTSKFYLKNNIKAMFSTIGLDQLIHTIILVLSYLWLLK